MSRLATIYVETIRNIPILLQLIFVYTVLVSVLPAPRESLNVADMFFLNTSGLFVPRVVLDEGAGLFLLSIPIAIVATWIFARVARQRREAYRQEHPAALDLAGHPVRPADPDVSWQRDPGHLGIYDRSGVSGHRAA